MVSRVAFAGDGFDESAFPGAPLAGHLVAVTGDQVDKAEDDTYLRCAIWVSVLKPRLISPETAPDIKCEIIKWIV